MCRYALSGPYKPHYVCFECRKAFKQPPIEDYLAVRGRGYVYKQLRLIWGNESFLKLRESELGWRLADLEEEYRNATHKCPECGSSMIDMGLDLKAPKQSDAKAWKILESMYRVGHAFHTCGCNGPGWVPKSTNDYRAYLSRRRSHYEEQIRYAHKSNSDPEAIEYWASRINAIDREQASGAKLTAK